MPRAQPPDKRLNIEVLPGLEPFAQQELATLLGVDEAARLRPGELECRFTGKLSELRRLRTVVAVYLKARYDVPRPKGLLGDEHARKLKRQLLTVLDSGDDGAFKDFRFSAAGQDSPVFERLANLIAETTGLNHNPEAGALLIRVRKSSSGQGWEVLARLTPKPLSARAWRVCNVPGGLNATVAVAMLMLCRTREDDRVLNAMCGSGTLLIERWLSGPAARLLGVDQSAEALSCADENIRASGADGIELIEADATELARLKERFNLIVADLPWGDAVGAHHENRLLYPEFLAEMARLASQGARMAVLTHDIKVFAASLAGQRQWTLQETRQVFHGGHHPRIYLLRL